MPCEEHRYNDGYRRAFLFIEDELLRVKSPFDPQQRSNGDLTLKLQECEYHMVIVSKYRKKKLYGKIQERVV
jgi:hypothetical protein